MDWLDEGRYWGEWLLSKMYGGYAYGWPIMILFYFEEEIEEVLDMLGWLKFML